MVLDAQTKANLLELYIKCLYELQTVGKYKHPTPKQQQEVKQLNLLKENLDIILGNTQPVTIP